MQYNIVRTKLDNVQFCMTAASLPYTPWTQANYRIRLFLFHYNNKVK